MKNKKLFYTFMIKIIKTKPYFNILLMISKRNFSIGQ